MDTLKMLREKNHLSQEEMAKLLGISRLTYASVESGKRELKLSEIEKLETTFEISKDALLGKSSQKIIKTPKEEDPFYKFKQVFLYILNQCAQKPTVGKTVLNKLLYFADFNYYEKNFESITGVEYIKLPRWPVPKIMDIIIPAMESEQLIKQIEIPYYTYIQQRIFPLQEADISVLNALELKEIDDVIAQYSDKTADRLSDRSHDDMPYKATKNIGERIDYGLVHYRSPVYSVAEWIDGD